MKLGYWLFTGAACSLLAVGSCASNTGAGPTSTEAEASSTAFTGPTIDTDYAPYEDASAFVAAYRRLTESQYRNTIADLFGEKIEISGRFEPERREDGLQAVGNADLSITASGLEQYYAIARSIADQVMVSEQRNSLVGCLPGDSAETRRACAQTFIKWRGHQLLRRPLAQIEIDEALSVWDEGMVASGDFHEGLKLSLVGLLMHPEFLFRVERAESDPEHPDAFRLDAYSKATRLAHMLWDTAPDTELLSAARDGRLHDPEELASQVDRMFASDRVEDGMRAFFTDMLHFEKYDSLNKDGMTYPKFSQAVADSSREETLRFLVDHVVTQNKDYRDIFTAKETFLNRSLASVYDVPFLSNDEWAKVEFAQEKGRSGVLTHVSFLSLFSHPASSSPTIRGVKLHEIFMCLPTPEPPADVDFSKVQALETGTVRTRLIDHMTNPGCNTCHAISDPAGLTLEHFDGLGQERKLENGIPIDVSAQIGDKEFVGAQGLGQYMREHPLVTSCIVRNVHYYGVGERYDYSDASYLAAKGEAFAESDYRLLDLYRSVITDPEFFAVDEPEPAEGADTVGSAEAAGNVQGGQ